MLDCALFCVFTYIHDMLNADPKRVVTSFDNLLRGTGQDGTSISSDKSLKGKIVGRLFELICAV